MKQHEKEQLLKECETLWEQFDPIGVSDMAGGVDCEYRGYVPQTMNLVAASADQYKFTKFLQNCVYVNMGLSRTFSREEAIELFAKQLSDLAQRS